MTKEPINLYNLLDPNKFLIHYQNRKEDNYSQLAPIAIEIHPTSRCNHNCRHCSYSYRRSTGGQLPKIVFDRLIEALTLETKPQSVYFSGGGEPTLFSGWDTAAEKLLDHGVEIALLTNGTNIKEHQYRLLSKLNYVAVSFHSDCTDTFLQTTGTHKFDPLIKIPTKIKQFNTQTIVGARCVINKFNYKRLDIIYELAIQQGYDYIIFIPEKDYEGHNRSFPLKKAINYSYKYDFSIFDPKKTNANILLKSVATYKNEEKSASNICYSTKYRSNAFISFDGSIYLCQPDIGKNKFSIGNLNVDTFPKIWNSNRHTVVEDILHQRWSSGYCQSCRAIAYNKQVEKHALAHPPLASLSSVKFDPFL